MSEPAAHAGVSSAVRVLVVDDEPLTAEVHADYVGRIDGFEVAAVAHTAREALAALVAAVERGAPVHLVLLDLTLPDADGLDLARLVRARRIEVDFIAITAVRHLEAVQGAMAVGALQYLIKPFGFAAFREKLELYAGHRQRMQLTPGETTQQQVDELLSSLGPAHAPLPKALSAPTLEAVRTMVRAADGPLSASEVAERLTMSRVTARRYLEHLADLALAVRSARYGTPGRPEVAYQWRG
ncbi:MAG: hypothetical protein RI885_705 [Actinomycetota bacterium]|jgi:response regulator of citrate/malate metabolism